MLKFEGVEIFPRKIPLKDERTTLKCWMSYLCHILVVLYYDLHLASEQRYILDKLLIVTFPFQKWHPDKHNNATAATLMFQEINEAYKG